MSRLTVVRERTALQRLQAASQLLVAAAGHVAEAAGAFVEAAADVYDEIAAERGQITRAAQSDRITVKEMALDLNCGTSTIRAILDRGEIPCDRIKSNPDVKRSMVRVLRSDFEAWKTRRDLAHSKAS